MIPETLLTGIPNGKSFSVFADSAVQAFLLADDNGLRITLCYYWNCEPTIRFQTEAEIRRGSQILGTSLAKSNDDTLSFAYVVSPYPGQYNVLYRPNFDSSSAIVIDTWQSRTEWTDSPLFLRYDTSGRAIIGYQRFSLDSLVFVIKRLESDGSLVQVASWPLPKRIHTISHSPRQVATDRAYVALSGEWAHTFAFNSTNASSILPEPIEAPESNDTSPSSSSSSTALQPALINDWSNTSLVLLVTPEQLINGQKLSGFQVLVDYAESVGPLFSISYYRDIRVRGNLLASCGYDGCEDDVPKHTMSEIELGESYGPDSDYFMLSALDSAYSPSGYWKLTTISPSTAIGVFHYNPSNLLNSTYYYSLPTQSSPAPLDPDITPRRGKTFDLPVGLFVASVLVLIIGNIVWFSKESIKHHFCPPPPPRNIDIETKEQEEAVSAYCLALRN